MSRRVIKRALISVSDKTGLIPFAKILRKYGVEIISTGGTLKTLKKAKVKAVSVETITEFPEMLDGRVKTLHPKIHGGLLFRRDKKEHLKQAKKHGILPIDLVIVNLYPFEEATSKKTLKLKEAIEFIDIGGPSMLRSAAKNSEAVTVVTDPSDYSRVISDLSENKGAVSCELRLELSKRVFERTSNYDSAIAKYLGSETSKKEMLPTSIFINASKIQDLRYGENPHQKAAFYARSANSASSGWKQLHGKEISFNNLMDIEATLDIVAEFKVPAACVVKHTNPCGLAQDTNILHALEKAIDCDPMSAFGGIVGVNRECDNNLAKLVFEKLKFFEVFVAPSFTPSALKILKERKNLRLIKAEKFESELPYDIKVLRSGILVQEKDAPLRERLVKIKKELRFPTKKKLKGKDVDQLIFAYQCAKVVKSNAIVVTRQSHTVGIGAGQMSRVDAVVIACQKAGKLTENGMLGSDAFFPMPDSIEIAAKKKIRAIIQPGGSIRDGDVIAACDEYGIAMALTGERHFKH